ncbi:MAG: PD40 domain-containing protein [Cyclobacteriaceae bacterium]|nr:PD40 domain-containing protein [Cyclobacteriaceae bacterium]
MNNKIGILLLLSVLGCNNDPYPSYQEGEVLVRLSSEINYSSGIEMEPLITPDGQELVYTDAYAEYPNRYRLMRLNLFTNKESIIHPYGHHIDISSDGQWLAFVSNSEISKIKLTGDSLKALTRGCSPTWHPNNQTIAFALSCTGAGQTSGIYTLDSHGSSKFVTSNGWNPDFFPDEKKMVFVTRSAGIKFSIFDIATSTEVTQLEATPNQDIKNPKISPDGKQIVYWNYDGIYITKVDGTGVRKLLPHQHFYEGKEGNYIGFKASSPSWHPDGKHIIYQHFAITERFICPSDYCATVKTFSGILNIRKLKVRD